MTDFLLELLTEEIPARMQAAAIAQLIERFTAGVAATALPVGAVEGFVTPRRLVLIAHGVAAASTGTAEERRGPRADAPEGAIAGFVKSTGIARDAMEERDTPKGRFLYATIVTPGRSATAIIAELIPAIVRDFDWPKSMRWGDASTSTASPRWVRPLSGIVALLGDAVVPFAAAGITSGRTTFGHRFMSRGAIEIVSAATYAEQLRAAYVMLDEGERRRIIIGRAKSEARDAGLTLIEDSGLIYENAGLTEWPVPLLGRFDAAFLDVPREVIQLTMRTNQKYFACVDATGALAPAFVCVANVEADDGGAAIVAGNEKVLAARLSDAKFFWDSDLARVRDGGLASFTPKLADIVFHEKLGTVADKVERVAKLARWLVESGAVGTGHPSPSGEGWPRDVAALAALAETAARLCKADLVSATVGEFPEVQGIAGGHLALAEGLDPQIAAAIRDHYKPVGPSDKVPTAPVTVAVAVADKLDMLASFFYESMKPSGSKDPFALRRNALGVIQLLEVNAIRISLSRVILNLGKFGMLFPLQSLSRPSMQNFIDDYSEYWEDYLILPRLKGLLESVSSGLVDYSHVYMVKGLVRVIESLPSFLIERLKVQQREAGIRPDVIDAVFSLGGEDDLVRLVARARALQAVLQTPDGISLLAGYKRGANILRIEEAKEPGVSDGAVDPDRLTEPAEIDLNAALDAAVPEVAAAVADERFESAMTALARLRPAVDAFFTHVTVNAADAAVRRNRLALLARLRTAVHSVADFSKLDG
jgi:glycyl-tRNA synthetase beta chain